MLPILPYFVGPPANFNSGRFPTKIGLSESKPPVMNSTTGRWSNNSLPMKSVIPRTLPLMHYPHHFPYMILWLCCIATKYHTPTSYFLDGKEVSDHIPVVLFITGSLHSDKPILVGNLPPLKFSGGPKKQGRIGNIQGSWDQNRSVVVVINIDVLV